MTLPTILGVLIGGGLGFAWYRWIAFSSGTCPLLSNPYTIILYGMILGGAHRIECSLIPEVRRTTCCWPPGSPSSARSRCPQD
jgi:hypothetical protein